MTIHTTVMHLDPNDASSWNSADVSEIIDKIVGYINRYLTDYVANKAKNQAGQKASDARAGNEEILRLVLPFSFFTVDDPRKNECINEELALSDFQYMQLTAAVAEEFSRWPGLNLEFMTSLPVAIPSRRQPCWTWNSSTLANLQLDGQTHPANGDSKTPENLVALGNMEKTFKDVPLWFRSILERDNEIRNHFGAHIDALKKARKNLTKNVFFTNTVMSTVIKKEKQAPNTTFQVKKVATGLSCALSRDVGPGEDGNNDVFVPATWWSPRSEGWMLRLEAGKFYQQVEADVAAAQILPFVASLTEVASPAFCQSLCQWLDERGVVGEQSVEVILLSSGTPNVGGIKENVGKVLREKRIKRVTIVSEPSLPIVIENLRNSEEQAIRTGSCLIPFSGNANASATQIMTEHYRFTFKEFSLLGKMFPTNTPFLFYGEHQVTMGEDVAAEQPAPQAAVAAAGTSVSANQRHFTDYIIKCRAAVTGCARISSCSQEGAENQQQALREHVLILGELIIAAQALFGAAAKDNYDLVKWQFLFDELKAFCSGFAEIMKVTLRAYEESFNLSGDDKNIESLLRDIFSGLKELFTIELHAAWKVTVTLLRIQSQEFSDAVQKQVKPNSSEDVKRCWTDFHDKVLTEFPDCQELLDFNNNQVEVCMVSVSTISSSNSNKNNNGENSPFQIGWRGEELERMLCGSNPSNSSGGDPVAGRGWDTSGSCNNSHNFSPAFFNPAQEGQLSDGKRDNDNRETSPLDNSNYEYTDSEDDPRKRADALLAELGIDLNNDDWDYGVVKRAKR